MGADLEAMKAILAGVQAAAADRARDPVGATKPVTTASGVPKDAAWIAKLGDLCDDWERPIVVDGAWRGGTTDRYFSRWCSANISPALPDAPEFTVAIGVDHGDRPGKQIALLLYVDERDPEAPVVHVLDEAIKQRRRPRLVHFGR